MLPLILCVYLGKLLNCCDLGFLICKAVYTRRLLSSLHSPLHSLFSLQYGSFAPLIYPAGLTQAWVCNPPFSLQNVRPPFARLCTFAGAVGAAWILAPLPPALLGNSFSAFDQSLAITSRTLTMSSRLSSVPLLCSHNSLCDPSLPVSHHLTTACPLQALPRRHKNAKVKSLSAL